MYSAAFSPDGQRIVTASQDKTARIWDAATGKPIGEPLKGHEVICNERGVQPRRQAHRHRVRGRDGARLWDAATGKPIGEPSKAMTDLYERGVQPRRPAHCHRVWDRTARVMGHLPRHASVGAPPRPPSRAA